MLDLKEVEKWYLKGCNSTQIAHILNSNPSTVRSCICRHLKDLRTSHFKEQIRRKEVDRITRRESKQYMGDKDFAKRNRSIYVTDKNGDLILNREVAPIVSFDTPRKIINECSLEVIDKEISKSDYKRDLLFT